MQKISSYLYPNRIEVIADVALNPTTCPVEWKIVYQKPIKIYKGVDNVVELEIKNADQKRIDVFGKSIKFVLMDQTNREIETYDAAVVDDGSTACVKGLARITLPEADLADLDPQHLKFSSYIVNDDSTKTLLYGDTKYGAQGFIDLLDGIVPSAREVKRFENFQQETNYAGRTEEDRTVTFYSSAVPVKFYEAVPTVSATVTVTLTDFVGTLGIQGTKKEIIGHESFLNPAYNSTYVFDQNDISGTATRTYTIDTTDLAYIRVYYIKTSGTVDFFTVAS
jgi:hypothetical protein